jgi:hypothetical protein
MRATHGMTRRLRHGEHWSLSTPDVQEFEPFVGV